MRRVDVDLGFDVDKNVDFIFNLNINSTLDIDVVSQTSPPCRAMYPSRLIDQVNIHGGVDVEVEDEADVRVKRDDNVNVKAR